MSKQVQATKQRPEIVGYRNPAELRAAILAHITKHGAQSTRQIVLGLGRRCGQIEGQPVVDMCKFMANSKNPERSLARVTNTSGDRCQYAFDLAVKRRAQGKSSAIELERATNELEEEAYFSPDNLADERRRVMRSIVQRRGRDKFRAKLVAAYSGKCAVTGCDAEDALEAAHIVPYCGEKSDRTPNGLLLRADIHTLFDLDLIGIDPTSMKICLSPQLRGTSYADLQGKKIAGPLHSAGRPNKDALAQRWEQFSVR